MYRSLLAPIIRCVGYFTLGLILVAVVLPAPAVAEQAVIGPTAGPLTLDSLDVSVEPEYDSTDVLVVYEASFLNRGSTPYDGDILFHVPKGVSPAGPTNEVHICQVEGSNLHSFCAPYRTDQGNDFLTFTWKARQPIPVNGKYPIYIEYYYNPLKMSGTSREMEFKYHPAYTVASLNLSVLEPLRASAFKLDPVPLQSGKETGGFNHFVYSQNNLQPGSTIGFKATYVKPDNRPSISRQVGGRGQGSGGGGATSRSALLAVLGIMVAVFGGVFIVANRSSRGHLAHSASKGNRVRRAPAHRDPEVGARPTLARAEKSDRVQQREAARRLLLAGKISEATYRDIIRDLDEEVR